MSYYQTSFLVAMLLAAVDALLTITFIGMGGGELNPVVLFYMNIFGISGIVMAKVAPFCLLSVYHTKIEGSGIFVKVLWNFALLVMSIVVLYSVWVLLKTV